MRCFREFGYRSRDFDAVAIDDPSDAAVPRHIGFEGKDWIVDAFSSCPVSLILSCFGVTENMTRGDGSRTDDARLIVPYQDLQPAPCFDRNTTVTPSCSSLCTGSAKA